MTKLAIIAAIGLLALPVGALADGGGLERQSPTSGEQSSASDGPTVKGFFSRMFGNEAPQPAPAAEPPATETATTTPKELTPAQPSPKVSAEALWWEKTGNEVVYGFRDCAANHAAAAPVADKPEADYVSEAIIGPCREQFVTMTDVLAGRFGKAGYRKLSRELVDTTFIPAIRLALASASVTAAAPGETAGQGDLERYKLAMFNCFNGRADAFAGTSGAPAEQLAEVVLKTCNADAERYFDALFAAYPQPAHEREAKKQAALDETYRHAIERRIAIQRQRGPSVTRASVVPVVEQAAARPD